MKKEILAVSKLVKGLDGVTENGEKKILRVISGQYLNDEEHTAYMEDFTQVVNDTINRVIFIADKHNIDRDNAIQHFATIFKIMTEISTFQNWGETEAMGGHLECSVSGDVDIQCSMCGELYTADEVKEAAEIGEPFQFYDGKFLCPDCYDSYSRLSLEEQFETALNMGDINDG